MEKINGRIKQLRLRLHMSQEEFGKSIGLSKSGISNIESGTRGIRDSHIKLLCSTFNVDEIWLRTGQDLSVEVKELEAFISFLKASGYMVDVSAIAEDDCEFSLIKEGKNTVFSQSDFEQFQQEILNSIDYQIWKQNQLKG